MDLTGRTATQDAAVADRAMAEPCVAVLLSTFNGERYLREQLASLTAQTHSNWRLYWRDDGSSDSTASVMAEFADEAAPGRCVTSAAGDRMRATLIFLALLHSALGGSAAFF